MDLRQRIIIPKGTRVELEKTDLGYVVDIISRKSPNKKLGMPYSEYLIKTVEDHFLVEYSERDNLGKGVLAVKHSRKEAEQFVEDRFNKRIKKNFRYYDGTDRYLDSLLH